MDGVTALQQQPVTTAPIELHLVGSLRASTDKNNDILPTLRKARALFVVIALSDQQTVSRRFLASLLWSRNDAAQALARLRDTLRSLRQSLIDTLGDAHILEVTADRVGLRQGALHVAEAPAASGRAGDLALDLDGIDPALDDWLRTMRGRPGCPRWPRPTTNSAPLSAHPARGAAPCSASASAR